MAKRNEPCSCGSGKKYKKCCLTWHKIGLSSPPNNGLPNDPSPPGPSLGMIAGRQRWLVEQDGNYIWHDVRKDKETGKIEERQGWYTVQRREACPVKSASERAIQAAARDVALAALAVNPECVLNEEFLAGVIRVRVAPIIKGLQTDFDRAVAISDRWYLEAKAAKIPKVRAE